MTDRPAAPVSPPRRPARRAVGIALACAAALAPRAAGASDLTGLARVGAGYDEGFGLTHEFVRQTYQLRYARQVSYPISYRLSLLYQDDRGDLTVRGVESPQRSYELAPAAFVAWRLERYSLVLSSSVNAGASYDQETADMRSRLIQRHGASTRIGFMENADATAFANRTAFSGAGVQTARDVAGLGFDWVMGPVRVTNVNRVERFVDDEAGLSRTGLGPRLSLEYAQAASPRWSLGARYEFEYFRTAQDAVAGSVVPVPTDVQPVAGLYVVDDLPDVTAPMASEARLIDGALEASAGIDLGPGGASFHNLGLDMGATVTVDELRIHVRSGTGQPVPFGGPVSWTVWASPDGLRWAPVAGVSTSFSTAMSAYLVEFLPTGARYFKAVSFGLNTVETFVTELQPFVRVGFTADRTLVSHAIRQVLAVDAAARLAPTVRASFAGRANAGSIRAFDGDRFLSSDVTNTAGLTLGPYDAYTVIANATQLYATSPAGIDHSKLATSAGVTYKPIERFYATGEARYARERVGAIRTTSVSAALTSSAVVYDALTASAAATVLRQDVDLSGSSDYVNASAGLLAQLRTNVELRLDASLQRLLATRGDPGSALASAPVLQNLTFERYTAELRVRPNRQLDLLGRIGYAATATGEGVLRKARAVWEPFPGGSLRLSFDYDVEVDPLTGRSYQAVAASPHWVINAHANLALRYNDIRGSRDSGIDQQSVDLSFTLTL